MWLSVDPVRTLTWLVDVVPTASPLVLILQCSGIGTSRLSTVCGGEVWATVAKEGSGMALGSEMPFHPEGGAGLRAYPG